jgi:hypothetical protein
MLGLMGTQGMRGATLSTMTRFLLSRLDKGLQQELASCASFQD